jgi:hypothetical protein
MKTERQQPKAEKLVHRISQAGAAIALTASLAAGLGPAVVVGATALVLGAGRLSGGFGLTRLLERPRRRNPAPGQIPQPR